MCSYIVVAIKTNPCSKCRNSLKMTPSTYSAFFFLAVCNSTQTTKLCPVNKYFMQIPPRHRSNTVFSVVVESLKFYDDDDPHHIDGPHNSFSSHRQYELTTTARPITNFRSDKIHKKDRDEIHRYIHTHTHMVSTRCPSNLFHTDGIFSTTWHTQVDPQGWYDIRLTI